MGQPQSATLQALSSKNIRIKAKGYKENFFFMASIFFPKFGQYRFKESDFETGY